MNTPTEHYIDTNGINLHYLDYGGDKPILLLLHGLTANAHAFSGLVGAGLAKHFRVISPDQRGRGLSTHPAFRYSMEDHAEDVLGLMDALGGGPFFLGGHSFGGLLSMYIASHYPERVSRLLLLDAAIEMNPNTAEMLGPTLSRLDLKYKNWDEYLQFVKDAPYNSTWDAAMEDYYRADVETFDDGSVEPRSDLANILQVAAAVGNTSWGLLTEKITQPTLLINGVEEYTMGEPLLPDYKAQETVELLHDARYLAVDGNHHTMLYGPGATQTVTAIVAFYEEGGKNETVGVP